RQRLSRLPRPPASGNGHERAAPDHSETSRTRRWGAPMTALRKYEPAALPLICVDVVERGMRARRGWDRCEVGTNLRFDTAKMESYFFATWEPVLFDALLVAAAVEFCDKTQRRAASGWARTVALRIPVHEPDRWNRKAVLEALRGALNFLTGDQWEISFS